MDEIRTQYVTMLENGVYEIEKDPVRTSEVKQRYVICTERGWEVQTREKELSIGQNVYGQNMGCNTSLSNLLQTIDLCLKSHSPVIHKTSTHDF